MGYSHRWTIQKVVTPAQFKKWSEGARILVDTAVEAGIKLGNGLGEDAPEIAENLVAFNGVGNDGHETFGIALGDQGFDFCKTAAKPYDAVVTACLIHAKVIFGKKIAVSSDGSWDDWQMGQVLYETVFGVAPLGVFLDD